MVSVEVLKKNASGEVREVQGLSVEEVRNLPRVRYTCGYCPHVYLEGIGEVKLAYCYYTESEKARYKSYRAQHTSASSSRKIIPDEVREKLEELSRELSGPAKKALTEILEQYCPDPKLEKAREALAALDKESLARLLAALDKESLAR